MEVITSKSIRQLYSHLFTKRKEISTKGSYSDDIQEILEKFNKSVDHKFYAERRILIEEEGCLPVRGIIIEHSRKIEDFKVDFKDYIEELHLLAKRLDSRTNLFECLFKNEICKLDSWVEYEDHMVAYNYEL